MNLLGKSWKMIESSIINDYALHAPMLKLLDQEKKFYVILWKIDII